MKSFDDAEQLMDIMCRRLKDGIDPSIMFKEAEEADQQSIGSLLNKLTGRKGKQK